MICENHSTPCYYCDEVDLCWLEAVNKQKKLKGLWEALLKLLNFISPKYLLLLIAISKTEVITSEHLQSAFVAFELKVSLFLHNFLNLLYYIFCFVISSARETWQMRLLLEKILLFNTMTL